MVLARLRPREPFRISPAFEADLREQERRSLEDLMRLFGPKAASTRTFILDALKQETSVVIEYVRETDPTRALEMTNRYAPLLQDDDYLEGLRISTELEKDEIAQILAVALYGSSYMEPLARLASDIGISSKKADKNWVYDVCWSIPHMILHTLEFNALTREREGIPIISVYEHFYLTAWHLADVTLPLLLFRRGELRAEPLHPEDAGRVAQQPAFASGLQRALESAVMGVAETERAAYGELRMVDMENGRTYLELVAREGAVRFAWLHEYGHILHNHLGTAASPTHEIEADGFAAKILAGVAAQADDAVRMWPWLGVAFFLLLATVLESICSTKTTTHPPALLRLRALLNWFEHPSLRRFVDSVAAAWNPFLSRSWGLTLKV